MTLDEKTILTFVATELKAEKTVALQFVTPVLDKLAAGLVDEATKLANEIPNALIKAAVVALIAKYGPELPTLIAQYEGDYYDKLVAFIEAEAAKAP